MEVVIKMDVEDREEMRVKLMAYVLELTKDLKAEPQVPGVEADWGGDGP